jgi:uncharacterized protein
MTLASLDDRHLIVFARYPLPDETKTRLVPALGAQRAARLAKQLTEYVVARVRSCGCAFTIYGTGASSAAFEQWLAAPVQLQSSGDLGARMATAIAQTRSRGASRILLIGSDCPGITADILANAFDALNHHDVVIGPAADGGYYLIGMRDIQRQLFEQMHWSHAQVLEQTMARLGSLSCAQLPTLHDIDTPDDLVHLPPGFDL